MVAVAVAAAIAATVIVGVAAAWVSHVVAAGVGAGIAVRAAVAGIANLVSGRGRGWGQSRLGTGCRPSGQVALGFGRARQHSLPDVAAGVGRQPKIGPQRRLRDDIGEGLTKAFVALGKAGQRARRGADPSDR